MEDCVPAPGANLEDIAEVLRAQLRDCHGFIQRSFELDRKGHASETELKLATRLIQASASLAAALKRLEGTRQDIVVTHTPAKDQ